MNIPAKWDIETDIVVVGYGYAGGIAAIESDNRGLQAIILEKMPMPGGISICSGGGIRVANNASTAFAYLKRSCGGLTPDPVLDAMAKGLTEVRDYMAELARINAAPLVDVLFPGNYPLEGYEDFGFTMFGQIPGFDQFEYYPHARGLRGGARHFKVIEDNVTVRGIPVHLNSVAEQLIASPEGRVIGVVVNMKGTRRYVRSRRAVILTCGGFEACDTFKKQFVCGSEMRSAAFLGNTGDGIRMAQSMGAGLWHMSNVHGTYGFRHVDPDYPLAIRMYRLPDWNVELPLKQDAIMSWIVVDTQGQRYMNEYPPYMQDRGYRAMLHYDDVAMTYPRIPSLVIFDERGRAMYPVAIPAFNDPGVKMQWSDDNLHEVELGILKKAESIADLAKIFDLNPESLQQTVKTWNGDIASNRADIYGRPATTRMPIDNPPYYGGLVWPIVSNTQGGPVHNEHWQILNADGTPIPGLYEAGELGGIWGHLYLAGGNLAECYVGAIRAIRHAVSQDAS